MSKLSKQTDLKKKIQGLKDDMAAVDEAMDVLKTLKDANKEEIVEAIKTITTYSKQLGKDEKA